MITTPNAARASALSGANALATFGLGFPDPTTPPGFEPTTPRYRVSSACTEPSRSKPPAPALNTATQSGFRR